MTQTQETKKGRGWHGDLEGHARAGAQSHKGRNTPMQALYDALVEAREYIDGEIDVVDGDDGIPEANKAMQLAQLIDTAINNSPKFLKRK